MLFLRQLHLDLNISRLFYQCFAKITTFFLSRKVRYGSSLIRWSQKVWRKLTWKWRQDVKTDVRIVILTSCMTVVPPLPVGFTEIPVGYARQHFLASVLGRVHGNPGRVCKTTFSSLGWAHGNPGRVCKTTFPSLGRVHGNPDRICKKMLCFLLISIVKALKPHLGSHRMNRILHSWPFHLKFMKITVGLRKR